VRQRVDEDDELVRRGRAARRPRQVEFGAPRAKAKKKKKKKRGRFRFTRERASFEVIFDVVVVHDDIESVVVVVVVEAQIDVRQLRNLVWRRVADHEVNFGVVVVDAF
jgi:hypothetical protein